MSTGDDLEKTKCQLEMIWKKQNVNVNCDGKDFEPKVLRFAFFIFFQKKNYIEHRT